ncbi:MAG: hypothetical protein E7159_05765 [Firmicutes bacterium]|nr:hypothetical protein [Bacillota bacterium]
MKRLVFLCIILFIALIINVNIYNRNTYLEYTHHNYRCTMNIYNEDLEINYDYVYNISTDNQNHILGSEYFEEFKYENSNYYDQSKKFYKEYEDDLTRIFDDEQMIIKSTRNIELSSRYDSYEEFKNNIENKQFKCEEVL